MSPSLTATLAIYGAVLSTLGFLWQVFLWRRSRPQIVVSATMHESPTGAAEDWIGFEIRNRGGKPTTVEEIMFVSYENWLWSTLKVLNQTEFLSAYHRESIKLPVMLQPGEIWKGDCPLKPENERPVSGFGKSRRERLESGTLHFRVRCAHSDRLISGIVKPESHFVRM
jgi:hypothetical protein